MSENTENNIEQKEKKNNKGFIILIILVGLLTIFSAFAGFKAFIDGPKKIESVTVERDTERTRADKLSQEIEKAEKMLQNLGFDDISDLDSLEGEHLALRKEADAQAAKIKLLKSKIDDLIAASDGQANDLESFKNLYRKLKSEVWQLKSQIRDLKKRNQDLVAENAKLKEEKEKMGEELNKAKEQNNELSTKASSLEQKVALGARLQTYDMLAEGIRVRRNGSERATQRAGRAEKIRVAFTISKNDLTKAGRKTVYLRVIAPDGMTITDGGSDFEYEGKELAYTAADEMEYDNSKKDMVMYAKNFVSDEFKSGKYSVEVYCEGAKIGETSFEMK